jgi:hypothetical protein
MQNLEMRNMPDHHPRRGDQVEAWIKARRDEWDYDTHSWRALNDLLDDYRDAADFGLSLEEAVNAQVYLEEAESRPRGEPKKKKAR